MDDKHDQPFFYPFPKEVPRLDSMKPLEKHYSIVLPTVNHSGFLYKTASAVKLLQDRRAREGGCPGRRHSVMVARPEKPGLARRVDRQGCHMYSGRVTPEGFLDVVSDTQ